MGYLVGIDVGTSSTKTILIEDGGKVISKASQEYPIKMPHPTWAEQDPEAWWDAAKRTLTEVLHQSKIKAADIAGIGLSGQMHGAVFVGKKSESLRPAIIWADQRSSAECSEIYRTVGRDLLARVVCNPAVPGFMAPTLLWMKKHEPKAFERTHKVLSPKDYVRLRLTGKIATDVTDGSATLLFDVPKRRWSDEMLKLLEIRSDLLPEDVYESQNVTGEVTPAAAEETGLSQGIPVVGGGGDQEMQAVGNGIVEPGTASSTIGTGGVLFSATDQIKVDPRLRIHTFCHAVPRRWHVQGAILSGGLSLRWFRDNLGMLERTVGDLCGIDPYGLLDLEASRVKPGCESLIFLPYLIGERTPHMDPKARGVLFGLTLRHTRAHLVRAIMEGVTYALRDSLEIFKELGIATNRIVASGGGARSCLWRQIQADVFNCELTVANTEEQAAFGAALLAGVGSGTYKSVEDACRRTIRYAENTAPIRENTAKYEQCYRVFHSLYPVLKEPFLSLSRIEE
jgi:xylulokinase